MWAQQLLFDIKSSWKMWYWTDIDGRVLSHYKDYLGRILLWLHGWILLTVSSMLPTQICSAVSAFWSRETDTNNQSSIYKIRSNNTAVSDVYMSYREWVARFVRQGMVVCVFWELCILHFIFAFQVQPELNHNKSLVFSSCNSGGGGLYFFLRQVTHNSKDYIWKMAFSSAATMVG